MRRLRDLSCVAVLIVQVITGGYRIVVHGTPLTEPILLITLAFLLSCGGTLFFSFLKKDFISSVLVTFGNLTNTILMVYMIGYFYQISTMLSLINLGSILLFSDYKKVKIFFLTLCILSVITVNLTLLPHLEVTGLDPTNAFPFLSTVHDLAFMLIIHGIFTYFINLSKENNKTLKIQNQKLVDSKNLVVNQAKDLKLLNEAKNRFFANISHELRTPVTLMIGPIKRISKNFKVNAENRQLLDLAYQNSVQLLDQVNEILDLSKLNKHNIRIQNTQQTLSSLLEKVTANFTDLIQSKKIDFQKQYYFANDFQVVTDSKKVEIILKNLLFNALKFTPPNGRITLESSIIDDKISIKVIDTGAGIAEKDLPYVFERFFQSDSQDGHSNGGFGIGLHICKQYMNALNGKIEVESYLGKGSIFSIQLPMNSPKLLPLNSEIILDEFSDKELFSPDYKNTFIKKPHLLIVEDNSSICVFLNIILKENYQLNFVENGKAALEFLAQKSTLIDLIISDVMMPEMNGYQLLIALKTIDKSKHIPVIMLTARKEVDDKLKALRIGVDDYITKPFLEEELQIRVYNLIKNQQAKQEYLKDLKQEKNSLSELETIEEFSMNTENEQWLTDLETVVKNNISNPNLTIEMVATELFISRPQFFRRVKSLTGITPMNYIQQVRFAEARQLLEQKQFLTVKSVAHAVGFKSAKTFSINYKKRFGRLPSEYLS